MEMITEAILFTAQAMSGLKDKSGEEAVLHPIRVGMALHAAGESDTVVAAGILHDVVEDTQVTIEAVGATFGSAVRELVAVLTHLEGEKYFDYIDAIGLDPEATRIKMKDIEDNMMNPNRIMDEYGLYKRWAKAYHRLSKLW